MENVYTQKQIEESWQNYKTAHCWRYMKAGGKQVVRMTAPDTSKEAIINCKMVKLKDVLSFPKYLEIEYGK